MKEHLKQRTTPDGVDSLTRQAALLDRARHPGIVELLRLDEEAGRATLVTAQLRGRPLSDVGLLPPEEVAGLGAALATTLADLHDLGIVHAGVTPEHVFVREDGFPVLCGFGRSGKVGELAPGSSAPLAFATDIAGVGRIVRQMATGPSARNLRRVAEMATQGSARGGVTARDLASQLQSAIVGARLPDALAAGGPALETGPDGRRAFPNPAASVPGLRSRLGRRGLPARPSARVVLGVVAGLGATLVVGAIGISVAGSRSSSSASSSSAGSRATVPVPVVTTSTDTTVAAPPLRAPTTPATPVPADRPRATCPEAASLIVADVDGDGCNEVLTFRNGLLDAGQARWTLGKPGDEVVAGNWGCRNVRTLALLRPGTGEIFRLDGWAQPGEDLAAVPVAKVDGAVAVRAADVDGDGCHELVVERDDGTVELVRPGE